MLYRTTGSQPIFAIRREIDRLFDDTFGGGGAPGARGSWVPAVDVREDAGAYHFELEMPGVSPSEVEVTADQGVLMVRGEKRQGSEREEEGGRLHVTERSFGSFSRAFQLPQGADEGNITATFDNGLLSVRVAKRARPQPRRVPIMNADTGNLPRSTTGEPAHPGSAPEGAGSRATSREKADGGSAGGDAA